MKVQFSPLQLLDFKLLQSHYNFLLPEENEVDIPTLFESYEVNIDFSVSSDEENKIQLLVLVDVNQGEENKAGYQLIAEGMGLFTIKNPDQLEEGLKSNLMQFSTLNMMINNLRNIMYQTSNLGPMGGYLLPPIDISKLLKDKIEEREMESKKKK